ncbi:thioesterase family protein [Burkholderia aenigmatica]|uniref:thioesterase family protein n=1 Tax=Burkholderia aenigmatica TaxID=2015348 RepID=UPI001F179403|nr:thioesterase [Burkholderia aenigmatica]
MQTNRETRDPMPAKRTAISMILGKQGLVERGRRRADEFHPEVLSTSALVGVVEEACVEAMREDIRGDQCSIGNVMHFRHLAPTPSQAEVFATATFRMFDGELYWFDVVVADAAGPVASGSHARSIVERSAIGCQSD